MADRYHLRARGEPVRARRFLHVDSFGFTVTSTIYEVVECSRVLWGGTADGITGVHEWIFRETPAGGVLVTTNESFAGDPVAADAAGMQSILDGSLSSWLHHLKVAAESAT